MKSSKSLLSLLAIGDVHLGTRPSGLPDELPEWGVDPRSLNPEAALGEAVELAVREQVDAVLFAGDVVESTNARFEALRPLEAAVNRLSESGIPVFGVAGNHDVEALPRLAERIEGFDLIGAKGTWETRILHRSTQPVAELFGWSFPDRQVRESPLAALERSPLAPGRPGLPKLLLLHGDLDASGGPYAPFTSAELRRASFDACLLGHIHQPSLSTGDSDGGPSGYLGSLVGLDTSEHGPRGPWLVQIAPDRAITAQQVPLPLLRWGRADCQVAEDDDLETIGDRVVDEASALAEKIARDGVAPRVLGVRIRLVGATRRHDEVKRAVEAGRWRHANRHVAGTLVFVERVENGLRLAHDLHEVAKGNDPAALLARKLLALETDTPVRRAMLDGVKSRAEPLALNPKWSSLSGQRDAIDPMEDGVLVERLIRTGTALLGELLAQRTSGDAGDR